MFSGCRSRSGYVIVGLKRRTGGRVIISFYKAVTALGGRIRIKG